jgi:hypothetical protein
VPSGVDRERDCESRAAAFFRRAILRRDLSSELLHDTQRDRQSKSRSFADRLRREKRLEDSAHVRRGYARSGIFNDDGERAAGDRRTQAHQSIFAGCLRRIDYEVCHDLLQAGRISIPKYRFARQLGDESSADSLHSRL